MVKKLVMAVVALIVLFGTLSIEQGVNPQISLVEERKVMLLPLTDSVTLVRGGQSSDATQEMELRVGDKLQTLAGQAAELSFADNAVMRLAPDSSLVFRSENGNSYVFMLEKGNLWANTNFSAAKLNVVAGAAVLTSRKADFDIAYDGEKSVVRIFGNQVNVGLIEPGSEDGVLINSYLVAQGSQTTIFDQKVIGNADKLSRLLYSKLIKEFQYALYDKTITLNETWVKQNKKMDNDLKKFVAQTMTRSINARNLRFASLDSVTYQMGKSLQGFTDVLTFSDDKRVLRNVNTLFDHLKDAQYLLTYDRTSEAKERINLFNELVKQNIGDAKFKELFISRLENLYEDLIYVLPDNTLYEIKITVSDHLLAQLDSSEENLFKKFSLVRDYMNSVYEMVDTNVLLARLTLDQYSTHFNDFVNKERSSLVEFKYLIAEENQIMDNLLRQYPQFYSDSVFAFKQFLESQWLELLSEGPGKDEERQNIIISKIDFLKQLQNFFLTEKVPLSEAKAIAVRLINEMRDLETGREVGIRELFAIRLKDFGIFLRFLNTTDISKLRGVSVKSKYEQYIAQQKEEVSVEQAIQEFLGEVEVTPLITINRILAEIEEDLAAFEVTGIKLGNLDSIDQQFVEIESATLDEVVFIGRYDWDKKLISNLAVGGKIVSESPISLSSLRRVVVPEVVQEVKVTTPSVVTGDSKAERVAKILLVQKLQGAGVTLTMDKIQIINLSEGKFIIKGVILTSAPHILFAFDFDNKTSFVSSILFRSEVGDTRMEGDFALADLEEVLVNAYEQANE